MFRSINLGTSLLLISSKTFEDLGRALITCVSVHTEVRCNFRLCLTDKKHCDNSCYLIEFRVYAAQTQQSAGLVGTGRFAALGKRGTIDVTVPHAPSKPFPVPFMPQALCVPGSCWGPALCLPPRHSQWFSHQPAYTDQSTRNEFRTEDSGPESPLEFQKYEKIHSSISLFYFIEIKQISFKKEHENRRESSVPAKKFKQQLQPFWASLKLNIVLCDKRNL